MSRKNKESYESIENKLNKINNLDDIKSNFDTSILPEVDFSTFIFSLNSSALVQMGVLSDPISGNKSNDFILAKHTIDTISMLKEKTKGNLNLEEFKMISDILYDLKMLYVKKHK